MESKAEVKSPLVQLQHDDYSIAILCPMGVEMAPVMAMLDEEHQSLSTSRSQNAYALGRIAHHNVVLAVMHEIGNNPAARVVIQLLNDFKYVIFVLLVVIGGDIPDEDYDDEPIDIRLGDVVVSKPDSTFGGVVQFHKGKDKYERGISADRNPKHTPSGSWQRCKKAGSGAYNQRQRHNKADRRDARRESIHGRGVPI